MFLTLLSVRPFPMARAIGGKGHVEKSVNAGADDKPGAYGGEPTLFLGFVHQLE
jgi:hypothetical protein